MTVKINVTLTDENSVVLDQFEVTPVEGRSIVTQALAPTTPALLGNEVRRLIEEYYEVEDK